MAYDIYTPMQGPTIPTSIFSSAMERGARMGTMIDSPDTARLKGEIEGKTKALQLQQMRENIESANINQEAARVGIERQEEALEADKRANKLAPIKEGLGIAQDVMGLYSAYQGIQANNQKLELNQIKLDTQENISSITADTSKQVALNKNVEAHREAAYSKVITDAADASYKNDPAAMKTVLESKEFHSLLYGKTQNASRIVNDAFNMGALDKAERDKYNDIIFSAENNAAENRKQLAEEKRELKAIEAVEKSRDFLEDTIGRDVGASYEDGAMTIERLNEVEFFPEGKYGVVNGKVDYGVLSEDKEVDYNGTWILAKKGTGEIINKYPNKGYEINQHLSVVRRGSNITAYREQRRAKDAGFVKDPKTGKYIKEAKQEQPGPPPQLPNQSLSSAQDRLTEIGVPKNVTEQVRQQGVTIGKRAQEAPWYDLKAAALKIAPDIATTLSKDTLQNIDATAQVMAEKTLKQYDKASPAEKAKMLKNIQSRFKNGNWVDLEADYLGRANMVKKAEYRQAGLNTNKDIIKDRLTAVYKDEIASELDDVAAQGVKEGRLQVQQRSVFEDRVGESASTPESAAAGQASYEAIKKGTPPPDKNSAEEIVKQIQPAIEQIKLNEDLPDNKIARMQRVVVKVAQSPYLQEEAPQFKAIAAVESGGNPDAVSRTGVRGLMQVQRSTAEALNEQYGTDYNYNTPEGSIALSKLLLRNLETKYRGNRELIYAAYNAGEPAIDLARRLANNASSWEEIRPFLYDALKALYDAGRYKVNPRKKAEETSNYPDEVLRYEDLFSQLA